MKKSIWRLWLPPLVCFALTLALMICLKTVDVSPIGPGETEVGLSALNAAFRDLVGFSELRYRLTEWPVYVAIVVAAIFAVLGLCQWIRRRSLRRVDTRILVLGALLAVTVALYALFEIVPLNYRPVILPGESVPASSFPSSHSLTVTVVLLSCAHTAGAYLRDPKLRLAARVAAWVTVAFTVLGRMLSGAHWLTDVVGGLLWAATLLLCFRAALRSLPEGTESPTAGI